MTKRTFYISTPIYYPSDNLHIGHAYTTVAADAISRWHRQIGDETWFLTGTDEHGQKIERKARSKGKEPIEFVDEIVGNIKKLWELLKISYNDFIRTTEPRHITRVQEIFRRLYEKGDIYKGEYEGWYCADCEAYYTETQVKEFPGGKCPDHDKPIERLREEAYFFKLSRYADQLLDHIEKNPDFIQPASRRNEMIAFIKSGLEDLCVSRTSFKWGIPVPFDDEHVIYVWIDALSNYATALGWPDGELYKKFWPCNVHLVGKEIVRFHTIIWPITLLALGEPLPKQVFGHGWLVLESGKMSKTRGNVVDPRVLVEKYGLDAVRYFLLREVPFGADGVYSEEALILRTNVDLANDLGNLLSRATAMIQRFAEGVVPEPSSADDDGELRTLAAQVADEVEGYMERLELSNALTSIWKIVDKA
ncbi:MAG: methionine--tRNA ligase, partial [Actinobacteria bacterium]|nr:methionine--tRNA ligase [Actinomycetota bacterium]